MLHVPDTPKPALRAYSIASSDRDQKGFTLLLKFVQGGKASEFVWSLKGNETLNFTGPFGKVFFKEPPAEQIIFLNTGTGVSQHLCFLESLGEKYPNSHYKMLFGVRYENEIYYQSELMELKKKLPHFEFQYIVSRPSESWSGLRGHVQDHIKELSYLSKPTHFYLCGNGAMIKDVKARLTAEGFDANNIIAEAFN
jgi:NAD(P)H-flavin reductase